MIRYQLCLSVVEMNRSAMSNSITLKEVNKLVKLLSMTELMDLLKKVMELVTNLALILCRQVLL